jgi:hypothetical protein
MTSEEIKKLLSELDHALSLQSVKGEVCLYGGAVMCLVYEARPATKDVDAIFRPTEAIRIAVKAIAEKHNLREDWLNDAVKGFVVTHPSKLLFALPNLTIYVPEPDYLLAMKALSARVEGPDKDDVKRLIQELRLTSAAEVLNIVEKYYPKERIKPVTQFFVEELFER